jgi:hypothetical protein
MFGVRDALASSITDAFFIAIFVVAASVVVAMFMKDMPIRTTNQLEPEPVGEPAAAAGARAVSATGPRPSLPPIAGGAGDDLKSEGGERAPERTIDPSNS